MTNNTYSHPNFITNSPVGKDLFDGKAHERIADNLAQIILENKSESKLIGLDGSWGSGKSNVVKIIERKLESTHHVFVYDAWGHQEDLKRRSFLEELIENLCNNNLLDKNEWSTKLKELLAKKRETVTKIVPRLSNGIILTLLVAIFTPISRAISEDIDQTWLKVLISSIPIIVGVLIWLIASLISGRLLGLVDIFYLYKEKELNTETHVTISEKEPSVREFQHWLLELSENLISKKIIVVFDNMDRLPSEKVNELWSSIHTFFSEDSYKNIWVIVPFDRKHISDAFDNNGTKANHFINKTFSVIHRVTPPVLTDWKAFFLIKYEEAFSSKKGEEYQTVRNIFDLLQPEITPRNVIAFINELVSLRLIADQDIKSRYLAIFVLTKHSILKDPVNSILNLDFLDNAAELFKDDPMLGDAISALIYGVPIKSASQITLSREIELSLRNNSPSKIIELLKHDHFSDILEQVVISQELSIENTIRCLGEVSSSNSELTDLTIMPTIWNNLNRKRRQIKVDRQKFTDFDQILLDNCSSEERLLTIKYLISKLSQFENSSGQEYYEALNDIKLFCERENVGIEIRPLIIKTVLSPKEFIRFVIRSNGEHKLFKVSTPLNELNDYLVKSMEDDVDELLVCPLIKNDYDLSPLLEICETWIDADSINESNFENIYYAYKTLSAKKPIKLLPDNRIQSILELVDKDSEAYYDLVAMRLSRVNKFSNKTGISQSVLSIDDENLAEQITKRIEYFGSYGDLLIEAISWKSNLLNRVLQKLTDKSYGTSRLDISKVLGKFNDIVTEANLDAEIFLQRLNAWVDYAKKKISEDNIAEEIPDPEFFEHAIKVKNELTTFICGEMLKYLNSLDIESWKEILKDKDSNNFKILNWMLAGNQIPKLSDNLVTVYKSFLIQYAKDEINLNNSILWKRLYEKINKNKIKSTAKDIRDIFIIDKTISPELFIYFFPILRDHGDLSERSSDVVRKILAAVSTDDESLILIVENQDVTIPLIYSAGDDSYDLKDAIRQKVENENGDIRLIKFAETIGLDFKRE